MPTIQGLREQYYLSRREVSEKAGVSESSIFRMENGYLVTKGAAEKVLMALSELTGKKLTLQNVEGIKLYNIMRDRRNRNNRTEETSTDKGNGSQDASARAAIEQE